MARKADFSTTATNNAVVGAINWTEGQLPSTVNNSAREWMAVEKSWLLDNQALTTAGTSTAYTVTTSQGMATPADGDTLSIRLDEDCGLSPSLAVDGGTARNIVHSDGSAIAAGDLKANSTYSLVYRLTNTTWYIKGSGTQTRSSEARYGAYAGLVTNYEIVASVASNNLTVALKTAAGQDPSVDDPIYLVFPSATEASGVTNTRVLAAATSLVIGVSNTLGTINSTAFRYWIVAFDDAGTIRLAAINCRNSTTHSIYRLGGHGIASNVGSWTTSHEFFLTAAGIITSLPYIVLGYVEYGSGLATAGTYASGPTRIRLFQRGMHLPGDVVQSAIGTYATSADLTAVIPLDDTIPQSGEGTQVISFSVANNSAANSVRLKYSGMGAITTGVTSVVTSVFTSASANAIHASASALASGYTTQFAAELVHFPNSAASLTYSLRAGPGTATTARLNGSNTGRYFGGVAMTYLIYEEVMS